MIHKKNYSVPLEIIKTILLRGCILVLVFFSAYSQTNTKVLKDGLYLINRIDTIEVQANSDEAVVRFNPLFDELNEERNTRIVIGTKEFVPLELEHPPTTAQQTENKKLLLLSLTKEASEQLKTFTAKHVMQRVAIVVEGEVLTMHKIREAITSGQLQITRCNDNACELLFVRLKDNVKK